MLLVQEHLVKLGGIKLSGQLKSIDITETAKIEDIKDDKGKTKANQPTGYDAAKISIEFYLEATSKKGVNEQIKEMQRLFKAPGQKKAKLIKIVNEDCSARGISTVFFEKLTTKNTISESKKTATLELIAPTIAGITLKKKKKGKSKKSSTTATIKNKSTKSNNKSPSKNKRSTVKAKSKAKALTK